MSRKDTLTLFDELVDSGVPEAQARAQAKQLGAVNEEFNLIANLVKKVENDLYWMRWIGAAMVGAFMSAAIWG